MAGTPGGGLGWTGAVGWAALELNYTEVGRWTVQYEARLGLAVLEPSLSLCHLGVGQSLADASLAEGTEPGEAVLLVTRLDWTGVQWS